MSLKQRVSKLLVQDFCGSSENAVGLVQSVPICTHGPILQADLTVSSCLKKPQRGNGAGCARGSPLLLLPV